MPSDTVRAAGLLLRSTEDPPRWLLLCHRKRGEWGFPKGHAEPGEDDLAAALRECAEETGIGALAIAGPPLAIAYRLPDGRHKRVVYFPARTAQRRVRLSAEHRASAWCRSAEVAARLPHANLRELFAHHLAALARA